MSLLSAKAATLRPSPIDSVSNAIAPIAIILGASLLTQFFIGAIIGDFWINLLANMGISIILAVSLNIVNGFTGQFSIGHAGFMAVGGYTAGAITYYGSMLAFGSADALPGFMNAGVLLFVCACIAGGVMAALAGLLVGLPSLRLRGDYLAIVTLGFGEIVRVIIQLSDKRLRNVEDIQNASIWKIAKSVGGPLGFNGLPYYNSLFWTTLFVGVTLLVAARLKRSSTGRAFLSVREDEIAAQAMGIPITSIKVKAFVLSAAFAGIAGGLFAHQSGVTLNAGELNFVKSFDILIAVVLGGLGSISGVVLASIILTLLPEILRSPQAVLEWQLPLWIIIGVFVALTISMWKRRALREVLIATTVLAAGPLVLGFAGDFANSRGVQLGDYRMIIYALALILMMILRPQGLFGVHEVWDAGRLFARKRGKSPLPASPLPTNPATMPETWAGKVNR